MKCASKGADMGIKSRLVAAVSSLVVVALATMMGSRVAGAAPSQSSGTGLTVTTVPLITMLNMTVTLDQVSAGAPGKIGDIDQLRVVFDANAVDPVTKRTNLLNMQHFTNGNWAPPHRDDVMMPTSDAWLDMSSVPYRLHYRATVQHGEPIIIDADERSGRLSIHPQYDPSSNIESGRYSIDPTPITGPAADAAGAYAPH